MDPRTTTNLWIPVCCERVMRFNVFMQKNGTACGSLVCAVCSKSVSFDLEHHFDPGAYGDGARALHMLGAPKPPNDARRKMDEDAAMNDETL